MVAKTMADKILLGRGFVVVIVDAIRVFQPLKNALLSSKSNPLIMCLQLTLVVVDDCATS